MQTLNLTLPSAGTDLNYARLGNLYYVLRYANYNIMLTSDWADRTDLRRDTLSIAAGLWAEAGRP